MLAPFKSSKMLLSRARDHFNQFDELQRAFITNEPQAVFSEADAETGELLAKAHIPSIDEQMPVIAFDIINCLRSALDHAVFDSARVLGGDPKQNTARRQSR